MLKYVFSEETAERKGRLFLASEHVATRVKLRATINLCVMTADVRESLSASAFTI